MQQTSNAVQLLRLTGRDGDAARESHEVRPG